MPIPFDGRTALFLGLPLCTITHIRPSDQNYYGPGDIPGAANTLAIETLEGATEADRSSPRKVDGLPPPR